MDNESVTIHYHYLFTLRSPYTVAIISVVNPLAIVHTRTLATAARPQGARAPAFQSRPCSSGVNGEQI